VTVKYLLPCACGHNVLVEPRQAGESVVCACGSPLAVPTLLGITALERVEEEPEPQASPGQWGRRQRLLLLGTVVFAFAVAWGIWLLMHPPKSPFAIDPEQIRQSAQTLRVWQSWEAWQSMKTGLDRRTDQQYAAAVTRFRIWLGVVVTLTLTGMALIAVGMKGAGKRGLGIGDQGLGSTP
jgi:hypothetical protein